MGSLQFKIVWSRAMIGLSVDAVETRHALEAKLNCTE